MMREIKFSVWNAGNNKWLAADEIAIYPDGSIAIFGNKPLPAEIFLDYYPLITIEFFTGLLDHFGRDIYEGDILYQEVLSCDDPALGGRYGNSGVVEFFMGVYRVFWLERWHILNVDINSMSLEVIGNIKENPELIG